MMTNKELINHLSDRLDHIKNKLNRSEKFECNKELSLLRGSLNQANVKPSFPRGETIIDVVDTLTTLLNNIENNIKTLEIECGGVVNYSLYMDEQIKRLEAKLKLEKAFRHMLDEIYHERPQLKERVKLSQE